MLGAAAVSRLINRLPGKGGGGGGDSIKFYTGRFRPEVESLNLLCTTYTILDRKGIPFVHPPLTYDTSFTYQVYDPASLSNKSLP